MRMLCVWRCTFARWSCRQTWFPSARQFKAAPSKFAGAIGEMKKRRLNGARLFCSHLQTSCTESWRTDIKQGAIDRRVVRLSVRAYTAMFKIFLSLSLTLLRLAPVPIASPHFVSFARHECFLFSIQFTVTTKTVQFNLHSKSISIKNFLQYKSYYLICLFLLLLF